jgi:hypothetical protein
MKEKSKKIWFESYKKNNRNVNDIMINNEMKNETNSIKEF